MVEYYLILVAGFQTMVDLIYEVYLFTALVLISLTWSFVLPSRYINSVRRIINSYCIGFTNFVRTAAMALLMLAPLALILVCAATTPVVMVIGLALAGYLQNFIFKKAFERLEQPRTDTAESCL